MQEIEGRIIQNISNSYKIETQNDVIFMAVARGKLKQKEMTPLVGDKVKIEVIDEEKKEAVITSIFPRANELKRPKLANLTQIIFVVSMKDPIPDLLLLDKQLAYCYFIGIKPIICFNKIDLEDNENTKILNKLYTNIGYNVYNTDAKHKLHVDKLKDVLKNNITAFSGNSGVGKSTLINDIFDKEITKEGLVSKKNKKGKNTTTAVTLYKIENNSYIADTPGFASFDVNEIDSKKLKDYFIEFKKEEIPRCKYLDCIHIKEDHCGIKEAVADNKISKSRYINYERIYNEIKEKEDNKW